MRILLLTQWCDPEPTFKGLQFARELVKRGFQVEVLTGFPNYPGGKVYPGYKISFYQRELIDGVVVHRVPLYPSHDGSAIRRIANYISFAATSLLYGLFVARKIDLIYVYHPPLTVGMSGALLSYFKRVPFVYDIQDLWPDTLSATGMIGNRKLLNVISKVCDWVYSRADRIAVLSNGFRDLLIARGVPKEKISVIYNWCDEGALASSSPLSEEIKGLLEGRFNVLFAGTMGKAQALDAVLDAAQISAGENSKIQYVFVGGGIEVPRLKEVVAAKSIKNVIFLPRMAMSEVGGLLNACDALLVHLRNDPLFEITIPSKTQAYLFLGKPIVMAVAGDAAAIVNEANCGVCAAPENGRDLNEAISKLAGLSAAELSAMGRNGSQFYQEKMSVRVGVERFEKIFKEVLG